MKILILGSAKIYSLERIFEKNLSDLGHEVKLMPIHDDFHDYFFRSIFNKIKIRLSISGILRKLNENILYEANNSSYDIIWVFKGMEVFPSTLDKLNKTGAKLVNYNTDHPFEYVGKGSGNNRVLSSINKYDLYLTYSKSIAHALEEKYKVEAAYFPFGYEQVETRLPKENEEIIKVCFVGNADSKRKEILKFILSKNIPIDVYGNSWQANDFLSFPLLDINGPIFQEEFREIGSKYRIQLNIFRTHNENSHNMRTFDMPGLGGIMLAPESDEHNEFFEDGKEAFFYKSNEELISKIKSILSLDYEEAKAIREAAILRSQKSKYSYRDRTKLFLEIVKDKLKL